MPRRGKAPVRLTAEDRDTLEGLIAHGRAPARELSHGRILLKTDVAPHTPSWPDTKSPKPRR